MHDRESTTVGAEYYRKNDFRVEVYRSVPGAGVLQSMCMLPDGSLLVARVGGSVWMICPKGGSCVEVRFPKQTKSARWLTPFGGGAGVLITDSTAHCLWRAQLPRYPKPAERKASKNVVDVPTEGFSRFLGIPEVAGCRDGPAKNAAFSRPCSAEVSPDGTKLCISDSGNHCIRVATLEEESPGRIVATAVLTVSGSPKYFGYNDGVGMHALLHTPEAAAWNGNHTIVFADTGNHSIRVVSRCAKDGVIPVEVEGVDRGGSDGSGIELTGEWKTSTVAGGTGRPGFADGHPMKAMFHHPAAVCFAVTGSLLVCDRNNHRIRIVEPGAVRTLVGTLKGNTSDCALAAAQLSQPSCLLAVAGPPHKLFVADSGNTCVKLLAAARHKTPRPPHTRSPSPAPARRGGVAALPLFRVTTADLADARSAGQLSPAPHPARSRSEPTERPGSRASPRRGAVKKAGGSEASPPARTPPLAGPTPAEAGLRCVFEAWSVLSPEGRTMACTQWLKLLARCDLLSSSAAAHPHAGPPRISAGEAGVIFFTAASKAPAGGKKLTFPLFVRALLSLAEKCSAPGADAPAFIWARIYPAAGPGPAPGGACRAHDVLDPYVLLLLAANEAAIVRVFDEFAEPVAAAAGRRRGAWGAGGGVLVRMPGWLAFLRRHRALPGLLTRHEAQACAQQGVRGLLFAGLLLGSGRVPSARLAEALAARRDGDELAVELSVPEFLEAICLAAFTAYSRSASDAVRYPTPVDRLSAFLNALQHGSDGKFACEVPVPAPLASGGAAEQRPSPSAGEGLVWVRSPNNNKGGSVLMPALLDTFLSVERDLEAQLRRSEGSPEIRHDEPSPKPNGVGSSPPASSQRSPPTFGGPLLPAADCAASPSEGRQHETEPNPGIAATVRQAGTGGSPPASSQRSPPAFGCLSPPAVDHTRSPVDSRQDETDGKPDLAATVRQGGVGGLPLASSHRSLSAPATKVAQAFGRLFEQAPAAASPDGCAAALEANRRVLTVNGFTAFERELRRRRPGGDPAEDSPSLASVFDYLHQFSPPCPPSAAAHPTPGSELPHTPPPASAAFFRDSRTTGAQAIDVILAAGPDPPAAPAGDEPACLPTEELVWVDDTRQMREGSTYRCVEPGVHLVCRRLPAGPAPFSPGDEDADPGELRYPSVSEGESGAWPVAASPGSFQAHGGSWASNAEPRHVSGQLPGGGEEEAGVGAFPRCGARLAGRAGSRISRPVRFACAPDQQLPTSTPPYPARSTLPPQLEAPATTTTTHVVTVNGDPFPETVPPLTAAARPTRVSPAAAIDRILWEAAASGGGAGVPTRLEQGVQFTLWAGDRVLVHDTRDMQLGVYHTCVEPGVSLVCWRREVDGRVVVSVNGEDCDEAAPPAPTSAAEAIDRALAPKKLRRGVDFWASGDRPRIARITRTTDMAPEVYYHCAEPGVSLLCQRRHEGTGFAVSVNGEDYPETRRGKPARGRGLAARVAIDRVLQAAGAASQVRRLAQGVPFCGGGGGAVVVRDTTELAPGVSYRSEAGFPVELTCTRVARPAADGRRPAFAVLVNGESHPESVSSASSDSSGGSSARAATATEAVDGVLRSARRRFLRAAAFTAPGTEAPPPRLSLGVVFRSPLEGSRAVVLRDVGDMTPGAFYHSAQAGVVLACRRCVAADGRAIVTVNGTTYPEEAEPEVRTPAPPPRKPRRAKPAGAARRHSPRRRRRRAKPAEALSTDASVGSPAVPAPAPGHAHSFKNSRERISTLPLSPDRPDAGGAAPAEDVAVETGSRVDSGVLRYLQHLRLALEEQEVAVEKGAAAADEGEAELSKVALRALLERAAWADLCGGAPKAVPAAAGSVVEEFEKLTGSVMRCMRLLAAERSRRDVVSPLTVHGNQTTAGTLSTSTTPKASRGRPLAPESSVLSMNSSGKDDVQQLSKHPHHSEASQTEATDFECPTADTKPQSTVWERRGGGAQPASPCEAPGLPDGLVKALGRNSSTPSSGKQPRKRKGKPASLSSRRSRTGSSGGVQSGGSSGRGGCPTVPDSKQLFSESLLTNRTPSLTQSSTIGTTTLHDPQTPVSPQRFDTLAAKPDSFYSTTSPAFVDSPSPNADHLPRNGKPNGGKLPAQRMAELLLPQPPPSLPDPTSERPSGSPSPRGGNAEPASKSWSSDDGGIVDASQTSDSSSSLSFAPSTANLSDLR
ncbi:Protein wech [Diplonema papillatum]|nr:Protein wech [Diplonema papillatum]